MSNSFLSRRLAAVAALLVAALPAMAATPLADQPVFSAVTVPGNLALALSVEFPTAVSNAHIDADYNPASTYLGYFDPDKCYDYRKADLSGAANAIRIDNFAPTAKASNHTCTRKWSGNFLNWATTQTIDPFRWALTGGFRILDTTYATVLAKANASGQGGAGNFPDRTISSTDVIAGATPLVESNNATWTSLKIRIQGLGRQMRFSGTANNNNDNNLQGFDPNSADKWAMGGKYVVNVHARVCDSTLGTSYLEANCKQYGTSYKPEGLIQQYANQIRFSAFGYLNDGTLERDGGVLRARQKFVGPRQPVPGGTDIVNGLAEWSSSTGIMVTNPDPTDAAGTAAMFGTISNSGVMNYLNKFGAANTYKTYDPVGELYYATLRYFRNLGNVPAWSAPNTDSIDTGKVYGDGFPVITNWGDPVLYSCQKNFVLGIGDVNTHADRNLPGSSGNSEPSKPAEVEADTAVNATTFTNYVGTMSGISGLADRQPYGGCCTNNGALMSGLAYWANTTDIRPDMDGKQTVQTYWVDVLELQTYKTNNQYYLATKYGGANLPSTFDPTTRTADLLQAWWHTGASTDTVGSQLRPDTYFTAGKPDSMVSGLTSAFASIASRMKANSTALATTSRSISAAGTANYVGQFDASSWTGEIVARQVGIDSVTNALTSSDIWRFSEKLAAQLADTGWTSGRFMATFNTATRTVVPFAYNSLSENQKTALDTTYGAGNDASAYLDYLRGDRKNEQNSTVSGSTKAYRTRVALVGDIVNSKVLAIGPPAAPLSEVTNPGYAAFKTAKSARRTILVTGTNAGVVHVIDGSLTASVNPLREPGKELFAYVPGDTYIGPNGNAAADGLAWVGNPSVNHRFLVDGPIATMDVDFNRTRGNTTGNPDWRTLVVGGLGKGGRSIYALDLTDVDNINSDTNAAGKVLWEFSGTDMGFQFGEPLIAKVERYGWVVMVPAGHNNTDLGRNHLFILDAKTGVQLARLDTPVATPATPSTDAGTVASPSGMSTISAYYSDVSSLLAESVYGGDLTGAIWRFDLRGDASVAFPTPVKIVQATDSLGTAEPITTRTLVVIQPNTNRRWVVFGTGKLLATTDLNDTQGQRLYAIVDGNAGRFNLPADLPTGVSFPISPNNLQRLTDLSQPTTVDYRTKAGWYVDTVAGYRVVVDPTYAGGTVAYAATLPNNSNPCNPSGSSIVYAIDLGSGQSQLANNAAYIAPGFAVTDLQFVQVPPFGGTALAIGGAGDSNTPPPPSGGANCPPGTETVNGPLGIRCIKPPAGLGNRLLNWREVPLRSATGGIQ